MNLIIRLAAAALLAGAFAGAQAQTILRLGHPHRSTGALHAGAEAFKAELERLTNGRYKVQIFPSGALGGEKEMVEQAKDGWLDLVLTSTGPVGSFVPEVLPFDVPFLFRDYAHARAVLDGPIGQDALAKFAPRGIIGLAWAENGFRHLTNSKRPIVSPEDLKGLKVRTMQNDVHMEAFKTFGAVPTPLPFPDVFVALQAGEVDGQENPIQVITASKFSRVQKYLTLSGHFYSPAVLIASPKLYNSLSEADKEAFREAGVACGKATRKKVDELEIAGVAQLKSAGMIVNSIDKSKFELALAPAYVDYNKRFGDVLDKIRAVK